MYNLVTSKNYIDKSININNKINSYILFDFVLESCFIIFINIIRNNNTNNNTKELFQKMFQSLLKIDIR